MIGKVNVKFGCNENISIFQVFRFGFVLFELFSFCFILFCFFHFYSVLKFDVYSGLAEV